MRTKKQMINQELTAVQEDIMLETALEQYRETKQARAEVLFNEWLNFNITELRKDFADNEQQIFREFCKECYKNECEGLI